MSTVAQDPGPERHQEPQPVRLDPEERADLIERLGQVLSDPRDQVRSTASGFLHSTLQIVRLPKGHRWAALAGEGGFHRISQFYRNDISAKVSTDYASSDPARHARAKDLLEEAFGAYVIDEPL